jgi:hypothetical protein
VEPEQRGKKEPNGPGSSLLPSERQAALRLSPHLRRCFAAHPRQALAGCLRRVSESARPHGWIERQGSIIGKSVPLRQRSMERRHGLNSSEPNDGDRARYSARRWEGTSAERHLCSCARSKASPRPIRRDVLRLGASALAKVRTQKGASETPQLPRVRTAGRPSLSQTVGRRRLLWSSCPLWLPK